MDPDLEAIDSEWKTGDRDNARALALAYVDAHPELDDVYGNLPIGSLVAMIDGYRETGDEEHRVMVDAFLLARHAPQNITGTVNIGGSE